MLDETWIIILGSGLALGFALVDVAQALGHFVSYGLERQPSDTSFDTGGSGLLAVRWGRHELDFGPVLDSLVQAGVTLAVIALVVTIVQRYEESLPEDTPTS